MTRAEYTKIENYMLECMRDSAHDAHHVYRVLYMAVEIARCEQNVDYDILIAACLLHDVGRLDETRGISDDHALAGSARAFAWLVGNGYPDIFAAAVRDCVSEHRYRSAAPPSTIESQILFDSDKLDVTGMIGIARTFMYGALHSQPLYTLNSNGDVADGSRDAEPTFFAEYKYKLEGIYDKFYTARARELAEERRAAAVYAYEALYAEAKYPYERGRPIIDKLIGD